MSSTSSTRGLRPPVRAMEYTEARLRVNRHKLELETTSIRSNVCLLECTSRWKSCLVVQLQAKPSTRAFLLTSERWWSIK